MKGVFVFFLALVSLFAVINARPQIHIAEQTDTTLGVTNGWSGVVMAYSTVFGKAQGQHRVRVFGSNSISGDSQTAAWLIFNNTVAAKLNISVGSAFNYITGDVFLNATAWNWILTEKMFVTIATTKFPTGAISGLLTCRPHQTLSLLFNGPVIGGSTSGAVGLGFSYIFSSALFGALPLDILAQNTAIVNSVRFAGRMIHNVTAATSGTFNAPANTSQTAVALVTFTATSPNVYVATNVSGVTSSFFAQDLGNAYYQIDSQSRPNGDIRGQLVPTTRASRRQIPFSIETIFGDTIIPSLATLRFANLQGTQKNPNSFVTATATLNNGPTGNWTYEAFFNVKLPTRRKNFDNIRGFTLELNIRTFTTAQWEFDFQDASTGSFVTGASFSTPGPWTAAFIDEFGTGIFNWPDNRGVQIVRISVTSTKATSLLIDLFGLRIYESFAPSNQMIKSFVNVAETFPSK